MLQLNSTRLLPNTDFSTITACFSTVRLVAVLGAVTHYYSGLLARKMTSAANLAEMTGEGDAAWMG